MSVARAIDGIECCIETLRTQHGEEIPMGLNPASANRLAFTSHQPIGSVLASVVSDLADRLASEAAKMKTGDPTLEDIAIGPLVRPKEVDRVEQWANEAVSAGATLHTAFRVDWMPVGGLRESGLGIGGIPPHHGRYAGGEITNFALGCLVK